VHTVLVPGLLCSPRLFAPQLPVLWRHGSVAVADTLRDDGLDAIAARLLADAPERFVLAGLSMGGYVALEVLRQAPERVAALALLSTSARPDAPEQTEARRAQIAQTRDGGFAEVVDAAFARVVAPSRSQDAELLAAVRAMAADVGPEAFVRQQEAVARRPDSRPLLASIACPALVVHGSDDLLIDPEHGRELAQGIPGARLELLEGCGHTSSLEAPEAVATALDRLLADVA
jgi:pimeloyl-ACP methyl ester carboxylesterase